LQLDIFYLNGKSKNYENFSRSNVNVCNWNLFFISKIKNKNKLGVVVG